MHCGASSGASSGARSKLQRQQPTDPNGSASRGRIGGGTSGRTLGSSSVPKASDPTGRPSLRTRRARHPERGGQRSGKARPRMRGSCAKTEGPSRSGPEAARGRRVEGKGAAGRLTECGSTMGAPRPSLTPPRKRPPPAPRAPRRSGPLEPASTGRPSPPPCAAAAALPRRLRAAGGTAGGAATQRLRGAAWDADHGCCPPPKPRRRRRRRRVGRPCRRPSSPALSCCAATRHRASCWTCWAGGARAGRWRPSTAI